ncbi:hypothetical protein ACEWY4_003794 [Coilia grayii]|uniref:Suppressor of cytokine signaling 3 n=1 Tax=Coilia grayii TaxID=363190 RepID=A0ABD1KTE6_9TELE
MIPVDIIITAEKQSDNIYFSALNPDAKVSQGCVLSPHLSSLFTNGCFLYMALTRQSADATTVVSLIKDKSGEKSFQSEKTVWSKYPSSKLRITEKGTLTTITFGKTMVRQSIPMTDNSQRPPLRCKTFTGMRQHQLIMHTLSKLQQSGFYWGAINGREAQSLLEGQAAGTFLLRDSSDAHHFFTLSVRTQRGTKNLRVQCDSNSFWLESDPHSQTQPRFDCMLKMIHHYMPHGDSHTPSCYICSDAGKIPLVLRRPLTCGLTSLKHLCRKTVNGHQEVCVEREHLPLRIQEFLQEYDAPI